MGIPIGLFMLNFCIKGFYIQYSALSLDEPFSVYYALYSIPEIIEKLLQGNNPPLYEIVLHTWTSIFGISELSVRFPSLIFSSLSVCILYAIVKSHFEWKIAIISSLLFIFSSYHVEVAQEARAYALLGLFILLSFKLFFTIFTKDSKNKHFILWSIVSILLIYTHYLGGIVLATQISLFLFFKRNILKKVGLSTLLICVAFIPILPYFFERFVKTSSEGTWINPPRGLEELYFTLVAFTNKPVTAVLSIIILISGILVFKRLKKDERIFYLSNLYLFLVPFIGIFILSYFVPIFIPKYLIFLTFPLYILLAINIFHLFKARKLQIISTIILICCFLFSCEYRRDTQRLNKEVVSYITKEVNSETKVIISPSYYLYSFAYYYDIELFEKRTRDNSYSFITKELEKSNITNLDKWDHQSIKGNKKVLFLDADADFSFPKNGITSGLKQHFSMYNTKHFGPNIRVHICE